FEACVSARWRIDDYEIESLLQDRPQDLGGGTGTETHQFTGPWDRSAGTGCGAPPLISELSRWMRWLMTTHVRRYLRHYRSTGHVWQGRFKVFPTQEDEHLLTILRYIERNPLRAGLVDRAEAWPWSSLRWLVAPERAPVRLEPGTVPRGSLWVAGV